MSATRSLATLAVLLCFLANGAQSAALTDLTSGSLSITAETMETIIFGDGTKLVLTGSMDADVSSLRPCTPARPFSSPFRPFPLSPH